jgi:hypothetical protein
MDKKMFELLVVFIVGLILVVGHYRARIAASNEVSDAKQVVQSIGPDLAALTP